MTNIALSQIQCCKGDLMINVKKHIHIAQQCGDEDVSFLIFPELSLLGYEPSLAKEMALTLNQLKNFLRPLQLIVDKHTMVVGLGFPEKENNHIYISMAFLLPYSSPYIHRKSILHDDEKPFFTEGQNKLKLQWHKFQINGGICFEAFHQKTLNQLSPKSTDIFIASVSKDKNGVLRSYHQLSEIAKKYNCISLFVNNIGPSDNFNAYGRSGIWDGSGRQLLSASSTEESILIYDLDTGNSRKI